MIWKNEVWLDNLIHFTTDMWLPVVETGQWKQQDTAAKAVTCTSDTLQTIYNDTEYNMSCWVLVNYPYCGTYLMQFNVAKPFISMLKYAQQYTINIYMEKGILLIHLMLAIVREDGN